VVEVAARRRHWLIPAAAVLLLVVVALVVKSQLTRTSPPAGCTVTIAGTSYDLSLEQAANAATISAVGAAEGLSDHAVTIALATAFQESKLHNVPYGDRDSVGLFQQRPSQGWGTKAQLLDPHYSAAAFYRHLAKVAGWQTMPVADAAQQVQRSADGSAYAQWEPASRLIARALTGEVGKALACRYDKPSSSATGLAQALAHDVGADTLGHPVSAKTGWRTAHWLVAQSAQYSIDSVTFDGQRWTRTSGAWKPHPSATAVTYPLLGQ
jgi:hypothetical protein